MKNQIHNIKANESSFAVRSLHKVLRTLAYEVDEKEINAMKAGESTIKHVKTLQSKLNINAKEEVLVNYEMAIALGKQLKEKGFTKGELSFKVSGQARNRSGVKLKGIRLIAFDIDLYGVDAYRNVKTLKDISDNKGFEYLAEMHTKVGGRYEITFFDWQYRNSERGKADIVIYAVEGEQIIGRSKLVNSEDYTIDRCVPDLDVIIAKSDKNSEYEILMSSINSFLKESNSSLEKIAKSRDQLNFVASELDLPQEHVNLAAGAELICKNFDDSLSHELLYGMGRQNIRLSFQVFYAKSNEELHEAILLSSKKNIIQDNKERNIEKFVKQIKQDSLQYLLKGNEGQKDDKNKPNSLQNMLLNAQLNDKEQLSFTNALNSFKGTDFKEFWDTHLPNQPDFKANPGLIDNLLLTQQLTLWSGNNQAIVEEIQRKKKIKSMPELLNLKRNDWNDIIKKSGVPDTITGDSEQDKADKYIEILTTMLEVSFPTQKVASMVNKKEIGIDDSLVAKNIFAFLSNTKEFNIANSRVHDFEEHITEIAGDNSDEVKKELLKIQRVFQVSTKPAAMKGLIENKLDSAYAISNIPEKTFIKKYSKLLGGTNQTHAIHQRASHISSKSEMYAMKMMDYTHMEAPKYVYGDNMKISALTLLQSKMPNYSELFGTSVICECKHCQSVYSASAYMIDLLRYLWRGDANADGKTPLDILIERRPDIVHLPLTCENTNTIIPYIDLVNEIMEYYTVNNSLTSFTGYDTGEVSVDELKANPQNFNLDAYKIVNEAKYPFSLPYHQPLDAIRTYSNHLKVSRHEVMKAINPNPEASIEKAIEAESINISPEEYKILTGNSFDGVANTTNLHEYFGYSSAANLDNMSEVNEFLARSGMKYTELVELVKTLFINPYQYTLDFLENTFADTTLNGITLYTRLGQIEAGTLNPQSDSDILNALNAAGISAADFTQWVSDEFPNFKQVLTLYEPDSKCDIDTTKLKTIESIYSGSASSGISTTVWSKIHRFIRLWNKLGWTIHEVDLMLSALDEDDITETTISKLEQAALLIYKTNRPINNIAVLWGRIDTYGDKSLYKKLFLNKAVQSIDQAFVADEWGKYLQNSGQVLKDHKPAILAGFRITEEELESILEVAGVTDDYVNDTTPRKLDIETDKLNIQNLSTIYRYVVLAKATKNKIIDLCRLIQTFELYSVSVWDIASSVYKSIEPDDTYSFYRLATDTKSAGFKSEILQYIIQGSLPADSKKGINKDKVLGAVKTIREAFSVIEQEHPEEADSLTTDILTSKLSLTFDSAAVSKFMSIIDDTIVFETMADANLAVVIPESLWDKYTYVKGSGRLSCTGIMTDSEKTSLKALAGINSTFEDAVDYLYTAPETYISNNFDKVFTSFTEANATLLDHPAQPTAAKLDDKIEFVYGLYLPNLKNKLQKDTITQHIASLIKLSEEATALLIADDVDTIINKLVKEGLSASYYNDTTHNILALERVDEKVDFDWGSGSPDALVNADNFSTRWETYLVAPSSNDYTIRIDVCESDEAFKLYIDDVLSLEKTSGNATTSLETVVKLNASKFYKIKLEYAETSNKAGIKLYWKSATSALEIIPSSNTYPVYIVDDFVDKVTVFHRAAKFIDGFELDEKELNHLIDYNTDFNNIDFKSLSADDWKRIKDYTTLCKNIPQAQATLTDVFEQANKLNAGDSIDDLLEELNLATAWDTTNISYLANTHFSLGIDDFKNEIALKQIGDIMAIVAQSGLSAETIAQWGAIETDFEKLGEVAQLIKNSIKAKYEDSDWLDIAGDLSDRLRENQKQALISYLLTVSNIKNAGIKDADGLFEYFLIDVQMGACMDTSRIVQANAAIQLFVNRCFLNLESNLSAGSEKGVSPPDGVDKARWEWMQNFRVWEANRKVFLYPENWLEPEWRNDRSSFFKNLESYFVQNDINAKSVEEGFRIYLDQLNEVANLDVCGLYQENDDKNALKYLHVFARTNNSPYKYFYRTYNKYKKWSAWENVQVDIRSVEKGDDSGVPLIPVVWKERLFLFWPEFNEVKEENDNNNSKSVEDTADETVGSMKSKRYYEVRLGWSEYIDGKWSPKQLSKELIASGHYSNIKNYTFKTSINGVTNSLYITMQNEYREHIGGFLLTDIQAKIETNDIALYGGPYVVVDYANAFMKGEKYDSKLTFNSNTYLSKKTDHKLIIANNLLAPDERLDSPFFFSEGSRSYFVRPVGISIPNYIANPGIFKPYIPDVYYEYDPIIEVPIDDDPWYHDDPWNNNDIWHHDDVTDIVNSGVNPGMGDVINVGIAANVMNEILVHNNISNALRYKSKPVMRTMSANTSTGAYASYSKSYNMATASAVVSAAGYDVSNKVESAFGYVGSAGGILDRFGWVVYEDDIGMEFHTFYHPFSSQFVENLNVGGISRGYKSAAIYPPGLMESDTEIGSDNGNVFESNYAPVYTNGYIQGSSKLSDWDTRTYFKENICFDSLGANSMYNWELFFHAPLYIATRLSKNGKFEEAMKWFHYIFDPTSDDMAGAGESEMSRYWKVLPFKTTVSESLENWFRKLDSNTDSTVENDIIGEWRDSPFEPHLVASNRPISYMKHVVVKYVENLLEWGDSLFRQSTRESVNEAIQIYIIANQILGKKPEFVPRRGEISTETYDSLKDKWDDFSNALVELENLFPYSSDVSVSSIDPGTNMLGVGSSLYFCIPSNSKLLDLWETAADRLYKIRNCQDITGAERSLALFAPPIDPAALIQATSMGLSLGSILADLSSPPPIYRFTYLIQRANDFCADVKILGSALLSALEKKDSEELSRLRATHELNIQELFLEVKERQLLDAKANQENLLKARDIAKYRLDHYTGLLGYDDVTVDDVQALDTNLSEDSQLPADTTVTDITADVDGSLVDTDEAGIKVIPKEKAILDKSIYAKEQQKTGSLIDAIGGLMNFIPNFSGNIEPFGIGLTMSYGGSNIAGGMSGIARFFYGNANEANSESSLAEKMASFIRREQDWTLQANIAKGDIIQIDKQITSANIQIQIAEKEISIQKQRIDDAVEIETFLSDKFTNEELYQWMKEQLFAVHKQSFNLAFDMAKKTEKAYKYELGTNTASFIKYGYWDNSKQGLVSGEKLQLALRQMEKSYLEVNRRELELSKNVSLMRLNPLSLIELRETGKCYVSLPEEIFDLDYQGHYFRRIKSVSLSIPCIAGTYITVNCSLKLLKNTTRNNTAMNSSGDYEHENDEGLWISDSRFSSSIVPVSSIATSHGQNDKGMFEFSFRDERYLPFEGAGVISDWLIELGGANFNFGDGNEVLQQFDHSTIADVILHVDYTARENGGTFKDNALTYIKNFMKNVAELTDQPFTQMYSMKHEFSTEWHRFFNPVIAGDNQELNFTLGKNRFPFYAQARDIVVTQLEIFAKCSQSGNYNLILTHQDDVGDASTSSEVTMPANNSYGGINKVTIETNGAGLNLEDLDITREISMKLKFGASADYASLTTNPDEVEDIFFVVHYRFD